MNKQYTDITYIHRYVDGKLSPREMFELERAAQQDEMLMDIIMGVEFEKSQHLADNMEEIQRRIKTRVAQNARTVPIIRTFSWAKWSIAASLLVAIGISAYIFLSQQDQEKLDTIAYQPQEELLKEKPVSKEQKATDDISESTEDMTVRKKETSESPSLNTDIAAKKLPDDGQQIATRSSEPPTLPKDNIRNLDLAALDRQQPIKLEEIRLVEIASDDSINPTMEEIGPPSRIQGAKVDIAAVQPLKNQHEQAKIEQNIHSNSPQQVRAKLNNMNLDPQTSMMLNRVLDEQARTQQAEVSELAANKRKDIDLSDHNYTYLANVKSTDGTVSKGKKDSNTTEFVQTVTFGQASGKKAPIPASSLPVDGWKAFDDYLGKALSLQGITSGHLKFQFKINSKSKPDQIQVIYSDNKAINGTLIDILQKGPKWIPGKDAEKVELEVSF